MKKSNPKSRVLLIAYTHDGSETQKLDISYDEYYGETTPLIDSDLYRKNNHIVRIAGKIYDSNRQLQQSFENKYDDSGKYIGGRAAHSDGTVIVH